MLDPGAVWRRANRSRATCAVGALLGVGLMLLAGCGDGSTGGTRTREGTPVSEQATTRSPAAGGVSPKAPNGVTAAVRTPGFPGPLGTGFGSVWVAGHRNGAVHRVDPRTNEVVATIEVPDTLCGELAFGGGAVWAMNCGQGGVSWVYRIDPRSNRVTGRQRGVAPVVAARSLWLVDDKAGEVVRIDLRTGRELARIRRLGIDSGQPFFLTGAGAGSVWVYSEAGAVARIDPGSNRVTALVPLPGARPGGPAGRGFLFGGPTAFAGGAVWIANPAGLYRVDPAANRARRLPIRARPFSEYGHISLAADEGRVWMRAGDRRVVGIDPRTARVVADRPAGGGGGNIALGFGSLWVANAADDSVWRIGG